MIITRLVLVSHMGVVNNYDRGRGEAVKYFGEVGVGGTKYLKLQRGGGAQKVLNYFTSNMCQYYGMIIH